MTGEASQKKRPYRKGDRLKVGGAAAYNKLIREKSPENYLKYLARKSVESALARGTLTRKPCERCGAKAEAHHDDYSKKLEVTWLCRKHHVEHHVELKRREAA